jgi:hypothetical protein
MDEVPRREASLKLAQHVESMQKLGLISDEWDSRMLYLAIHSLTVYPIVFWQITYFLTGTMPTDPEFKRRWAEFLDSLSEKLFGLQRTAKTAADPATDDNKSGRIAKTSGDVRRRYT